MREFRLLSRELQSYIMALDSPDEHWTAEERTLHTDFVGIIGRVVDDLLETTETFAESRFGPLDEFVRKQPDLVEEFLDDRFSRDVVDQVSGYVERTLQLSQLRSTQLPSKMTNGYLQEAVRTYILGLPQASVALSRASVEQALKEGIGYQLSGTFVKMNDLLDEAETAEVIDRAHRELAREVATAADDVLHEKPTTLSKALDVLDKMRAVLQFVYSQE